MLLFFVQDDQPQLGTGSKHRRAGADNHSGLAAADPFPLVVPLGHTQTAVEHSHAIPEPGSHQAKKLGGQSDFRHQKQGGFPAFQTFLNQADVHQGLAGAGDTVEQCHPGSRLFHLGGKSLIAALLLLIQHQGALNFRGANLPAAQHGSLRKADIAQLLQPLQGRDGGAGIVADVLHRTTAHAAQQFQNAALQGGGFGPGSGELHGLLRRHRQGGHLLGFISDPALKLLLGGDPFFLQQIADGLLEHCPGRHGFFQHRFLRRCAQGFQKLQNGSSPLLADGGRLPAAVLGEGKTGFGVEPHPRRKHGPDGIKKGAEIPLPQEGCQTKLVGREQGLVVQHPLNGFQPFLLPRHNRQDNALGCLVGPPEADLDPVTGLQLHFPGNTVGIGLVNGKNSRRNSNLSDHKPSGIRLVFVLFLDGSGELAVGNLTDGHGNGLLGQVFLESLCLGSDLAGPMGNHVHQQITALHILQQISNRGIKHFS